MLLHVNTATFVKYRSIGNERELLYLLSYIAKSKYSRPLMLENTISMNVIFLPDLHLYFFVLNKYSPIVY